MDNHLDDTFVELTRDYIETIISEDTIVFCGAGISMHSGPPLVNDIVSYLLYRLSVNEKEIEQVMGSKIPFEAFIEIVTGDSDPSRLFDMFDFGEPNTNHILLAKLAKSGKLKIICTTNFDQLIETAMVCEGMIEGDDYEVFYKENELESIDWDDKKIKLIKIHGSVTDKINMAITLKQVASRIITIQRKNVIEYIFSRGKHKNVLILGYSCSDRFDISPQIESIKGNKKRVILIDHCSIQKSVGRIENIIVKEKNNPFRNFEGSTRIYFDTDELMKYIWLTCLESQYLSKKTKNYNTFWKKCVNDWLFQAEKKFTAGVKYSIAGNLFAYISIFNCAIKYYKQALQKAKELGHEQAVGNDLGNLAAVYQNIGNYQKAVEYCHQALKIARKFGDKQREAAAISNLATAFTDLGEYNTGIKYHKKALRIARNIGDREGESNNIGNLGATYQILGNYKKAIDYYHQAIKIARDIGDKKREANFLGNIGLFYYDLKKYQKAKAFNEQALRIAKEIGHKQGEGHYVSNLSLAYKGLGDMPKAIEFGELALTVAKEISDTEGVQRNLCNLSVAYNACNESSKAIEYGKQALQLARESEDKIEEMRNLINLGSFYHGLGNFQKAIEYGKLSLEISVKLRNDKEKARILKNLGMAYYKNGNTMKGLRYAAQGLKISDEFNLISLPLLIFFSTRGLLIFR